MTIIMAEIGCPIVEIRQKVEQNLNKNLQKFIKQYFNVLEVRVFTRSSKDSAISCICNTRNVSEACQATVRN